MTESSIVPEEHLSRQEAEEFIRIANIIFKAMGEPNDSIAVVMEIVSNERFINQLHFLRFNLEEISGTQTEVSDQSNQEGS